MLKLLFFLNFLSLFASIGFSQVGNTQALDCPEKILQKEKEMTDLNEEFKLIKRDLQNGLFCSECLRSKTELDKREGFEKHLSNVKGKPVPATQKQMDEAYKKYLGLYGNLKTQRDNYAKECNAKEEQKKMAEREAVLAQKQASIKRQKDAQQARLEAQAKQDKGMAESINSLTSLITQISTDLNKTHQEVEPKEIEEESDARNLTVNGTRFDYKDELDDEKKSITSTEAIQLLTAMNKVGVKSFKVSDTWRTVDEQVDIMFKKLKKEGYLGGYTKSGREVIQVYHDNKYFKTDKEIKEMMVAKTNLLWNGIEKEGGMKHVAPQGAARREKYFVVDISLTSITTFSGEANSERIARTIESLQGTSNVETVFHPWNNDAEIASNCVHVIIKK